MVRLPNAHDLILVGGGLASSLIAWRLSIDRPDVRVAVVERDGRLGGKHTWSFFDGDVAPDDRGWLQVATRHRWPGGYDIYFPGLSRILGTPYNSMISDDLRAEVEPILGDRLITGEVVEMTTDSVTLADGRVLTADGVIDARGPQPTSHLDLGWQVFLGRTVRLSRPHGLTRPTIMDATVAQGQAYRFVYLLPFDANTILVEDTYYADSPKLDRDLLRQRIDDYIISRGWAVESLLDEEEGVLPIALDGDIDAFWAEGPPVARVGLAAALFHPTTGYSFPDAVQTARLVSGTKDLSSASLRAVLEAHSKKIWADRAFYRLLDRMLFRASDADRRWRVMRRFYGLSEGVVRRFYAARSTWLDKARVLAGKSPVPIDRALKQIRETGKGRAA
ncbi:MAG: lycopene cyclase [Alphaproteobacteria bacterium]|nr:MAG: lycopene cyclase [Alphaproteobacteria bacterium]PZO35767.1 MAG: lycopene cyclase [Alphaproteobacteria bacterium]